MKKFLKNFFRFIIFIIILAALAFLFNCIYMKKNTQSILNQGAHFDYEELLDLPKDSVDVVFVGPSALYYDISPTAIYHEYGYTSVCLGTPDQKIWQSYYYLEDYLNRQSPKVVVLEAANMGNARPQTTAYNYEQINMMPWSKSKIGAIYTTCKLNPNEKALDYIFPVFAFHSRVYDLGYEDYTYAFTEGESVSKGSHVYLGEGQWTTFKEGDYLDVEKAAVLPNTNLEFLAKIESLCQEKGTQLVIVKGPSIKGWNGKLSLALSAQCEKDSVEFYDYNGDKALRDDLGIDWDKHSPDGGQHLNYYGMQKYSSHLGGKLAAEYKLEDHRNDPAFKSWEDDFEANEEKAKSYLETYGNTLTN